MLSAEGDADAAVEARIRFGWNKFKKLVPLLTNKDIQSNLVISPYSVRSMFPARGEVGEIMEDRCRERGVCLSSVYSYRHMHKL